ncbi:MAG TPA: hypothetical protein VL126_09540 [Bacteroidota bacterium]|nr:hypothetical protein [Bacteroidota bacterium]
MAPLTLLPLFALAQAGMDTLPLAPTLEASSAFELLEDIEDEAGADELMEDLDWASRHPLDLNRVRMEELLVIPAITIDEAMAVMEYRKGGKTFRSVDELRTITGGGERLYHSLGPFVTVAGKDTESCSLRTRFVETEPLASGLLGPPLQMSSRISVREQSAEFGAEFVKRAGERIADGFASGYAIVRPPGVLRAAILGDYEFLPGQGLLFSKGPSPLRDNWSASSRSRAGALVAPHRSSGQSHFLRGLALSFAGIQPWGHWEMEGFVSDRCYGANLNRQGEVTSIYSGSYATVLTEPKRNVLRERLVGFRAACGLADVISFGWTAYRARLNRAIRPQDPTRISGNAFQGMALDARSSGGVLDLFAEWAILEKRRTALSCGTTVRFSRSCTLVLAYRNYAPGYDNLHASGFSENGETRNERGLYTGVKFTPIPQFVLQWSHDQIYHCAPSLEEPLPRGATRTSLSAQIDLPLRVEASVRYSEKNSETVIRSNDSWGKTLYILGKAARRVLRCSATLPPSASVRLTTQAEFIHTCDQYANGAQGALAYQQISVLPVKALTLSVRVIVFRTSSYAARAYELESDLPGLFTSPALSGSGHRVYTLLQCAPTPSFTINAKYALTNTIGSAGRTAARTFALQLDGRIP